MQHQSAAAALTGILDVSFPVPSKSRWRGTDFLVGQTEALFCRVLFHTMSNSLGFRSLVYLSDFIFEVKVLLHLPATGHAVRAASMMLPIAGELDGRSQKPAPLNSAPKTMTKNDSAAYIRKSEKSQLLIGCLRKKTACM
jgi:hypothetical protein